MKRAILPHFFRDLHRVYPMRFLCLMKWHILANIGRTLLFSLLPLAVLLLAIEIGVRVASIDVRSKSRQFPINQDIDFPEIYKLDYGLFWRFRPNQEIASKVFSVATYRINSRGFRGDEPRPDAACRIVALGNSCSFGWAVREQYIWTTVLESMLNETQNGTDYDVINAGVPGYSSHQGRILCSELLSDLKPQYLCIMFGWNDHWTAGDAGADRDIQMPSSFTLSVLNVLMPFKSFQLFQKLAETSDEPARDITINTIDGARRVPIEQFRENLDDLVDSAQAYGATPLLIIPPIAPESVTTSALQRLHRQYEQIIREVAEARKVTCVDLQSAFDSTGDLFPGKQDPVHFGVEGHRLVAGILYDVITEMRKGSDSTSFR